MAADDTRTRIIHAAGPIFAEKGFKAATIREIRQKAGVNQAAINYHYGSKENLYLEAISLAHPAKFEPLGRPEWPEGTRSEVKLRDFICSFLTNLLGQESGSWQEQLMMREFLDPTPACREMMQKHLRLRFGLLQEILDEILPQSTPAHKRHQIGFSVIGQCVLYRSGRKIMPLIIDDEEIAEHYSVEQLAEHITQVSLAALGLGPSVVRLLEDESDLERPVANVERELVTRADGVGRGRSREMEN
jgi:AcrR family transcriptional regulator